MTGLHLKFIRIGNWQPIAGIRFKSWVIGAILLLLGLGNAVAGAMEWHDTMSMLVFNGVFIVLLILAVMQKVMQMEPRKMWRVLSFIVPGGGMLALFCARVADSNNEYPNLIAPLIVVGGLLLVAGAVCIIRWRKYSLAHKELLKQQRNK